MSKLSKQHGIPICRVCGKPVFYGNIQLNLRTLEDYYLCGDCKYKRKYGAKETTMTEEVKPSDVEIYRGLKNVGRWLKIKQVTDIPTLEQFLTIETKPRHIIRIKSTIKKLQKAGSPK